MDKSLYHIEFIRCPEVMIKAHEFRTRVFFTDQSRALDQDIYDENHQHIIIKDNTTREIKCYFRLMHIKPNDDLIDSYSAQFYDLTQFSQIKGDKLEIGRFCIDPQINTPAILRMAWSEITRFVDRHNIKTLFGCTSFHGTETAVFRDSFALLKKNYIAPSSWRPKAKSLKIHYYPDKTDIIDFNLKRATKNLPSLLRSYLTMGGRVSDHAVIDTEMQTLHVFTALLVSNIPEKRKMILRADSQVRTNPA